MKSKEGTRLSVSWVSFFHFFHTKLGQAEFLKSKGVMHCKYFFPGSVKEFSQKGLQGLA